MEEALKGKLTKEEHKHLREEAEWITIRQIKAGFKIQKVLRDYHPGSEPCPQCKAIAIKLELPV